MWTNHVVVYTCWIADDERKIGIWYKPKKGYYDINMWSVALNVWFIPTYQTNQSRARTLSSMTKVSNLYVVAEMWRTACTWSSGFSPYKTSFTPITRFFFHLKVKVRLQGATVTADRHESICRCTCSKSRKHKKGNKELQTIRQPFQLTTVSADSWTSPGGI